MALILVVLLLILIFGGVGLAAGALHFLLWIALILFVLWIIGFFVRGVEGARWYRW